MVAESCFPVVGQCPCFMFFYYILIVFLMNQTIGWIGKDVQSLPYFSQ